jgi:hypothetical protein
MALTLKNFKNDQLTSNFPVFANRNPILSILTSVVPTAGPLIFIFEWHHHHEINATKAVKIATVKITKSPEEDCEMIIMMNL